MLFIKTVLINLLLVSLLCKSLLKRVRIRSYSGPYCPAFGLNTELCIQSECGNIRTRITPNTDTFYAVTNLWLQLRFIWNSVRDGNFWMASHHYGNSFWCNETTETSNKTFWRRYWQKLFLKLISTSFDIPL